MTTLLERVIEGGARIDAEEALALFAAPLVALGIAADARCRARHPQRRRTYVVDRNINYTNVCVSRCRFCAFWRAPEAPDAYVLTVDEILAKIAEAQALGATQILMQGGLHPDLPLTWYEDLLRTIKSRCDVHLHSFSPPEIVHLARVSGRPVAEVLDRLIAAGLDSLPGGGAEVLADLVRQAVSPGKCSSDEWLQVMALAHRRGLPTTATMMFGHRETLEQRIEHLLRLRQLQDETGGFTAFIPWTYQPGHTNLGGREAGGHDYLRTLAVSRIVLDNFEHLQASWVTQGPKLGQVALHFGADDFGSTMIEENVVRAAGAAFQMTEREMIALIEDAGFEAARRDTRYRMLASAGDPEARP